MHAQVYSVARTVDNKTVGVFGIKVENKDLQIAVASKSASNFYEQSLFNVAEALTMLRGLGLKQVDVLITGNLVHERLKYGDRNKKLEWTNLSGSPMKNAETLKKIYSVESDLRKFKANVSYHQFAPKNLPGQMILSKLNKKLTELVGEPKFIDKAANDFSDPWDNL